MVNQLAVQIRELQKQVNVLSDSRDRKKPRDLEAVPGQFTFPSQPFVYPEFFSDARAAAQAQSSVHGVQEASLSGIVSVGPTTCLT